MDNTPGTENRQFFTGKKKYISIAFLLILIIAIPLTIYLAMQEQDNRQKAAETPTACSIGAPGDVMLIMDASGSMDSQIGSDPKSDETKLTAAKAAATSFVNKLALRTELPKNYVGYSTFNNGTEITLEQALTSDYARIKTAISSTDARGNTCIECGIKDAIKAFELSDRGGIKNVAILLSDGVANSYVGSSIVSEAEAERRAMAAVVDSFNRFKVTYYTIAFGTDANPIFLQDLAAKTGGKYYFAPDDATLDAIYQEISTIIAKGEVSGTIYNDANNNRLQDSGELVMSNQTVELRDATTDTVIKTVQSDSAGLYRLSGLCDGTYKVIAKPSAGYTITTPINPDSYTLTILNGNILGNNHFGLRIAPVSPTNTPAPSPTQIPTPTSTPIPTLTPTIVPSATPVATNTPIPTATPVPESTKFSFTAFMHGIGNSGDNANPNVHSLSNKNPVRQQRTLAVEVYDSSNQMVLSKSGLVIYNTTNGNFTGTIDMGTTLTSGVYNIKVKSPQYLRKRVPGIQTVTAGQTAVIPEITFVTGDINGDNALNILDYNILIGCYSDFAPPTSCTGTQNDDADLTDDGKVNQFDYNLFLRDFSVQNGE